MWCIFYVCFYVERGQKTVCLVYCGEYAHVFIFCENAHVDDVCGGDARGWMVGTRDES